MITNTTQPLPGIYLNSIFNEEDSPDAEMLVVQPDADVDVSSTTSNGDYASYGEYADYGNAAQYAPHSSEVAKAIEQGFAKYVPSETRNHSQSKPKQKARLSSQQSANDHGFSHKFHAFYEGADRPTAHTQTQNPTAPSLQEI